MKLFSAIALLCFLLTGCTNIKLISDNEDKGIKEILALYGGFCEYSIGASLSTDKGSSKFFELKVSKSEGLDRFSAIPEVAASNIAYLFYKNLKEERGKYSEIHSVLLFDKQDKYEASYTKEQLESISSKMKVLNKVLDLIKAKDFAGIRPFLSDDSYTKERKDALVTNLPKLDARFGNYKGFTLLGFKFETLNGVDVLDILGIIDRDKQNNEFCLKVDLKPSEDKIHYLDYTLSQ